MTLVMGACQKILKQLKTNMEIHKTIDITFEEAKAWFNSNNETIKELALKAFTEKELKAQSFSTIKTFEDGVKFLGMDVDDANAIVNILKDTSKATAAMYKLNIVREALSYWHDLHLTKDPEGSYIYYPYNPFVTKSSTYYESDINSDKMEVIGKIKSKGKEYNVLGGLAIDGGLAGLGGFFSGDGVGVANAYIGFIGCANKEIAQHLGKYFGMLITEAKYGDLSDFKITEDKYGNA